MASCQYNVSTPVKSCIRCICSAMRDNAWVCGNRYGNGGYRYGARLRFYATTASMTIRPHVHGRNGQTPANVPTINPADDDYRVEFSGQVDRVDYPQ